MYDVAKYCSQICGQNKTGRFSKGKFGKRRPTILIRQCLKNKIECKMLLAQSLIKDAPIAAMERLN